jgi:hypothetical protein
VFFFACIFVSVRWRFVALRVDLREGRPAETSSANAAFLPAAIEGARLPRLRSVALTPGWEVSTGASRRGRGGVFGFFGPDRSCQ